MAARGDVKGLIGFIGEGKIFLILIFSIYILQIKDWFYAQET